MDDLTGMTDEEIFIQLNTTDETAVFIELYNRYYAQLYSAACKRCSSTEAAEEIVQDLFINLWKTRHTIRISTSVKGYLHTAVRNLILNHIEKEAVRKKYEVLFGRQKADYDNSTEESVISNDLIYHINSKVNTLPDKCRSVFELSRNQHKSNKQIAYELGISEKTVENHITRAIKSLRASMSHILFMF